MMKINKFTIKNIVIKSPCNLTLKTYIVYLNCIINKLDLTASTFFFPKQEKKITVLKSPHVFKKAKEQFKFCTYKALIQIKTVDTAISNKKLVYILLNKPKSIFIKIKS